MDGWVDEYGRMNGWEDRPTGLMVGWMTTEYHTFNTIYIRGSN